MYWLKCVSIAMVDFRSGGAAPHLPRFSLLGCPCFGQSDTSKFHLLMQAYRLGCATWLTVVVCGSLPPWTRQVGNAGAVVRQNIPDLVQCVALSMRRLLSL